uniref:RecQ mediated genome instability protein 1-like N-terminal helical domain-containing protein n=1 Tax=Globodera rostochiensis TaxID=31243 RepID=A0A914GSX8_GLORO
MVENAPEVERYFAERHIRLKKDWLLEALHFVSAEKSQNRLVDLVYQQWLFADIKTSTEPIDGLRQLFDGRSLYDPYVFQIHSISDIGTSNLKQYKRLTDPSYEEPIEFDQPNPKPAGGKKCQTSQYQHVLEAKF